MLNPLRVITLFEQIPDQVGILPGPRIIQVKILYAFSVLCNCYVVTPGVLKCKGVPTVMLLDYIGSPEEI